MVDIGHTLHKLNTNRKSFRFVFESRERSKSRSIRFEALYLMTDLELGFMSLLSTNRSHNTNSISHKVHVVKFVSRAGFSDRPGGLSSYIMKHAYSNLPNPQTHTHTLVTVI